MTWCVKDHSDHLFIPFFLTFLISLRVALRSVSTWLLFCTKYVESQVLVPVTRAPRCISFHKAVTVFYCLGQMHMEVTFSKALRVLVVNPLQRFTVLISTFHFIIFLYTCTCTHTQTQKTSVTNGSLVNPIICKHMIIRWQQGISIALLYRLRHAMHFLIFFN